MLASTRAAINKRKTKRQGHRGRQNSRIPKKKTFSNSWCGGQRKSNFLRPSSVCLGTYLIAKMPAGISRAVTIGQNCTAEQAMMEMMGMFQVCFVYRRP
jgi:hypothetical protein